MLRIYLHKKLVLNLLFLFFILFKPSFLLASDLDSSYTNTKSNMLKNVSFNGSLSFNNIFYSSNSSSPQRVPYSYQIFGSATIRAYGVSLPFSFIYSEQERSFSQPFNKFGISPQYKWIKLHIGYRNLTYSPFTLGGYSFLGVGADLTPGKFRFSFMKGQFMRAISSYTDTLGYPISYKRKGFAGKIGWGTNANHVDLIFLRVKDDYAGQPVDSLTGSVTPGENSVLGASFNFLLWKYFTLSGDYATSLYTQNILAADYLGYHDTLKNYVGGGIAGLFDVNSTTRVYNAFQTTIAYDKKIYGVRFTGRRIDPGYLSFGTYYFQDDILSATINPFFQLFKSRVIVDGSIGLQQDNLSHQKTSTTNRIIGSVNLNIVPKPNYGITIQYINYTTGQRSTVVQAKDTLYQGYVSENISVMPRYSIIKQKMSHNFFVLYSYQQLFDQNIYTAQYTNFGNNIMSASYNLSLSEKKSGYTLTLQQVSSKSSATAYNMKGLTFAYTKSFWKGKANSYSSVSDNFNYLNNSYAYNTIMLNTTLGMKVYKGHQLNVTGYYIFNNSKISSMSTNYQLSIQVGYTYVF